MVTTKANSRASHKRIVKATVLELARMQGRGDGKTYAECVACGDNAIVGIHPGEESAFELGHDKAEANGGEYRLGNLHPMCASCNDTLGTRNLRETLILRYDIYAGWNGKSVSDPGPSTRRLINKETQWNKR